MNHKQLYRSRQNRILGGVAGGIAEYFEIDPLIVRIIFVLLSLGHAPIGIMIYGILWLVVPENPDLVGDSQADSSETKAGQSTKNREFNEKIKQAAEQVGHDIKEKVGRHKTVSDRALGLLLLILGLIFLGYTLVPAIINLALLSPLILILLGIWLVVRAGKGRS